MMNDIVRGKTAWARLKNGSKCWSDWVLVGHALLEGRAIAMRDAGTTAPTGENYASAFNDWLLHQPLRHKPVATRQAVSSDEPPARDRAVARDVDTSAAAAAQ